MPPGVEIIVHARIRMSNQNAQNQIKMSKSMTTSFFVKMIINLIGTFQDPDTMQDTGTGDGEEGECTPKVSSL